jgi:DNA-binding protein Fis
MNQKLSASLYTSPDVVTEVPLRDSVTRAVREYLSRLGDYPLQDLYPLVMAEVEKPLLATVLEHTRSNQSKAAKILGISRGTLRKKLEHYQLTGHPSSLVGEDHMHCAGRASDAHR